ncbi:hypothetical protein [Laribacter hongkongensis]|uniref:hypothetical protein n=1 Tax=Laribacter hongkongensis TaxID=168471 RepID=UPI001EFCC2EE|nr:hypothetical protein [Laribacter hongkongensis]MCG9033335.1 hypothetical protein [Laribacter hongkongensis]MCG9093431.1 hypothetical protein [Laribacter hongkongensis]
MNASPAQTRFNTRAVQLVEQAMTALNEDDGINFLSAITVLSLSLMRNRKGADYTRQFMLTGLADMSRDAETRTVSGSGLAVDLSGHGGPVNPDDLDTIALLRAELVRVGELLQEAEGQATSRQEVLEALGRDMSRIVLAHLSQDATKVKRTLDEFCERHVHAVNTPSRHIH